MLLLHYAGRLAVVALCMPTLEREARLAALRDEQQAALAALAITWAAKRQEAFIKLLSQAKTEVAARKRAPVRPSITNRKNQYDRRFN